MLDHGRGVLMGAAAAEQRWSRGGGWKEREEKWGEGEPRPICCAFLARAERVNGPLAQPHRARWPPTRSDQDLQVFQMKQLYTEMNPQQGRLILPFVLS